jgi:hypothetical protein
MSAPTRSTLLRPAFLAFAVYLPLGAATLEVRLSAGRIRVSASGVHFVAGKPLDRLRNGAPVAFALQLSVTVADRAAGTLARDVERYVLSYDLWEEKFSVVKLGSPGRSTSHLSAEAAEAWCIGDLGVPAEGLDAHAPLRFKLEIRAEATVPEDAPAAGAPVSLSRLIDVFSRRPRQEEPRWSAEAGPLRLSELNRTPRGGSRSNTHP